ncbi:MAG: mechanosensitive ion channel family protein [Flavobacteriales bacterium]|nr:mechanosensitive ion channel family protein [Flavobacteriales bacterium]
MTEFLELLRTELVEWYTEFVRLLPRLAFAILFFIGAYLFADLVRRLLRKRLDRRSEDNILSAFLARVAKGIVLLMAVGLVLKILGLGGLANGMLAGAGIGAFIVGFAFKDIGENFLAGILLAFKRPFKPGDIVEMDGFKGKVEGIALRTTHMRTSDGRDVYIPNSTVVKNTVINFTEDGFLRHALHVRVEDHGDMDKASALMLAAANGNPGVLHEPWAPVVGVGEVGPDTVELVLTYWVNVFDLDHPETRIRYEVTRDALRDLRQSGFHAPATTVQMREPLNE